MNLLERAKTLRQRQTDAEQCLWYYLRAHRFMGLKFKRQMPMGHYIVDFVCHECRLIVELDGGQHQDNAGYDAVRDAWLRKEGYGVLRFWNHEVLLQTDVVLEAIRLAVLDALSPGPSPASGRGEPNISIRDHPSPASERGEPNISIRDHPSPASERGESNISIRDHPSPACGRGAGGEGDV